MRPNHEDANLIESLGGSAAIVRLLDLKGNRALQRVENWKRRGIPAAVRLKYLSIFPLQNEGSASEADGHAVEETSS